MEIVLNSDTLEYEIPLFRKHERTERPLGTVSLLKIWNFFWTEIFSLKNLVRKI